MAIFFIIFLIIIFVLITIIPSFTEKNVIDNKIVQKKSKMPCILCNSILFDKERLKSEEYKTKDDSVVYVYGCPNCYGENAVKSRICPVCKRKMKSDEFLFGRMFYRKSGKRHLHINGCNYCKNK